MKILTVCQKGNMRSVSLAFLFKKYYKQDVIAMGIQTNNTDTKKMLYEWADVVILTSNKYQKEIPAEYVHKLKVWHVGTDRWFKGYPDDLMEMFQEYIDKDGGWE